MKKLFLDDMRSPPEPEEDWDVVRNYQEFTEYITNNGVPEFISFDHDLGKEHYTALFKNIKKHILEEGFEELTGYDCAKWLVEHDYKIKKFSCHSMNPIGKLNILTLLTNWEIYSEGIKHEV